MKDHGFILPGASALVDSRTPLGAIVRSEARVWPLVVFLGLIVSLLEGIGIGLLVPIAAILLAPSSTEPLPEPLGALAEFAGDMSPEASIAVLGSLILMAVILKTALQSVNALLIARIDVAIARRLIDALGARILSLEYATYLGAERARLLHVLSTDSWAVAEAARAGLSTLPALAGLLLFGGLLLWLDPLMLGLVVAAGLVLWMILRLIERRQRRLGAAATAANRVLGWQMLSVVEGVRTVRLFGEAKREEERFARASQDAAGSILAVGRLAALTGPFSELLLAGLFLLILFSGIALERPAPALAAFLLILLRSYPYAATLSQARVELAARHRSMTEVEWLLDQASETPPPENAAVPELTGTLELREVSYSYPGRDGALTGVDCDIPAGSITALMGPTGAGKSTLVSLIARLSEPDAGTVLHDGSPAETIPASLWRARMAYAGQDVALIEGTVRENIRFGSAGASDIAISQAAQDAGAAAMIEALPQGYDTPLGPGGRALSGGQRQRIALARALLRKPDILVLDEATSAIDAPSEAEIVALLRRGEHFHTAIVISHRSATLAACAHGIVLREGRVTESGPIETLAYFQSLEPAAR